MGNRLVQTLSTALRLPMFAVLAAVGAIHALWLTVFYFLPIAARPWKNFAAELLGFSLEIYLAVVLMLWGSASILIAARYERLGRFDATRMQQACAFGICAVLLLLALGARSAIPGFEHLYASAGADLPASTLVLFAAYPYWYVIPLLGVVTAGVLCASSREARVRRGAFDALIGLLVLTNLAMVTGFIAMVLSQFKLCGETIVEGDAAPLHAAASLGRADSVLRLIAAGEPVDARDSKGNTPLQYALMEKYALLDGHADVVRALLAKGADVNAANEHGGTPLITAVIAAQRTGSSLELVELLLEAGARVNAARNSGQTPLHYAAYVNRIDVAAKLLAKGADVNALAINQTPLDLAYEARRDQLVELLLQHGGVRASKKERETEQASIPAPALPSARGCG